MFDLLITGGQVVAPDGAPVPLDLGVQDGRIAALGPDLGGEAKRQLNAAGTIVLPGVIDLHTHLRSPAGEEELFVKETASAVAGGVTTVGDFAYPPGTRFELEFERKRDGLERQALCDFVLHTVVTMPEQLEGVQTRTVKVFLTSSGLGARAGAGLELVQTAFAKGHQVLVHAEALEDYVTLARCAAGGDGAGAIHILHVPHQRYSQAAVSLSGGGVTLETCPHYLLWEWIRGRAGCDVNPRVEPADLWPEVQAGRMTTIGTDHCSYTWQEKQALGLPGFPGVETLLPILATCGVAAGRISWADLTRLLSAGPARVLGLYPRKGAIQIGSDADLVLFDPSHEQAVETPRYGRSDFSPYRGLWLRGRVVATLVRGRQVYTDGSDGSQVDWDAAGWGTWQQP